MSCFHPLGLAKRQLYKQVEAASKASAGTEAHLSAIRSFHKTAWECFEARKVDPPQRKAQYVYSTRQGEYHSAKLPKAAKPEPIDRRTKKAIYCIELDCSYCWQELNKAIDNWGDGCRAKIRCIDALSKWRKTYDAHWDAWTARGRKKLPSGLKRLAEFAEAHGQLHFVAGADAEGKLFGTAKEAQRYSQGCESIIKTAEADAWYHSETNQRLIELFDRTQKEPELWSVLEQALKQVEAEDKDKDDEESNQSQDGIDG